MNCVLEYLVKVSCWHYLSGYRIKPSFLATRRLEWHCETLNRNLQPSALGCCSSVRGIAFWCCRHPLRRQWQLHTCLVLGIFCLDLAHRSTVLTAVFCWKLTVASLPPVSVNMWMSVKIWRHHLLLIPQWLFSRRCVSTKISSNWQKKVLTDVLAFLGNEICRENTIIGRFWMNCN